MRCTTLQRLKKRKRPGRNIKKQLKEEALQVCNCQYLSMLTCMYRTCGSGSSSQQQIPGFCEHWSKKSGEVLLAV